LVSESASTTRILLDVVDRLQQQSLKTVVECLYDPLGGQEDGIFFCLSATRASTATGRPGPRSAPMLDKFKTQIKNVVGLFNPELTIETVAWKAATTTM
jgi:hypothetical protein